MIVISSTSQHRCDESLDLDMRPSEWLELHSHFPIANFSWLIDRHSIRPLGWKMKFAVPKHFIKHFAAVSHRNSSCTLMLLSPNHIGGRRPAAELEIPYETRPPVYSELGTTFNADAAKQMLQGIEELEHVLVRFTWPEFLDQTFASGSPGQRGSGVL